MHLSDPLTPPVPGRLNLTFCSKRVKIVLIVRINLRHPSE